MKQERNNMVQKQQSCVWLARKYLLFSIGVYATLSGIMAIKLLSLKIGVPELLGTFLAFWILIFARTFYEQLAIYDISLKNLTPSKNAIFAFAYATIMSLCYYFIRTPLGSWGIPIALVIAQSVIRPVQRYLWPAKANRDLELYSHKKRTYVASLYGFYGLLALVVVTGVKILHVHFIYSFGAAVLIALIASILFEIHYLYEQKFQPKAVLYWVVVALCLAMVSMGLVFALITWCGFQGKPVTIGVCVVVKLLEQYLLSKWNCA